MEIIAILYLVGAYKFVSGAPNEIYTNSKANFRFCSRAMQIHTDGATFFRSDDRAMVSILFTIPDLSEHAYEMEMAWKHNTKLYGWYKYPGEVSVATQTDHKPTITDRVKVRFMYLPKERNSKQNYDCMGIELSKEPFGDEFSGTHEVLVRNISTKEMLGKLSVVIRVCDGYNDYYNNCVEGEEQHQCKTFKSNYCFNDEGGNRSVHILPSNIKEAEDIIEAAMQSRRKSAYFAQSLCDFLLKTIFCKVRFPKCSNSTLKLPICKSDCDIMGMECSEVFSAANFSKYASCATTESEECEPLRLKHANNILKENRVNDREECYRGNGTSYHGLRRDVIYMGEKRECMEWKKVNNFDHLPIQSLELRYAKSYCRNPTFIKSPFQQPWCYISVDSDYIQAKCNIQKCSFASIDPKSTAKDLLVNDVLNETFFYNCIFAFAIIMTVLVLLIAFFCFYVSRGSKNKMEALTTHYYYRKDMNPQDIREDVQDKYYQLTKFSINAITFQEELGQGEFGTVYKGELKLDSGEVIKIAIKTLKDIAHEKRRQSFYKEARTMSQFDHCNIVQFKGICLDDDTLGMLFEYMAGGDLHEMLVRKAPHSDANIESIQLYVERDMPTFLSISKQIAAGMNYLGRMNYVHRDLAARNILIGGGSVDAPVVKISDFGLTREIYEKDYYRIRSRSLLPVRWMPPEAILYGKFSTKGDVYSFGVVLWEIFSYGLQPYYDSSNSDVPALITHQHLLPIPDCCPATIYRLMQECWHHNPEKRPTFQWLRDKLTNWYSPQYPPSGGFTFNYQQYC